VNSDHIERHTGIGDGFVVYRARPVLPGVDGSTMGEPVRGREARAGARARWLALPR
jgi:hypothetical protein